MAVLHQRYCCIEVAQWSRRVVHTVIGRSHTVPDRPLSPSPVIDCVCWLELPSPASSTAQHIADDYLHSKQDKSRLYSNLLYKPETKSTQTQASTLQIHPKRQSFRGLCNDSVAGPLQVHASIFNLESRTRVVVRPRFSPLRQHATIQAAAPSRLQPSRLLVPVQPTPGL